MTESTFQAAVRYGSVALAISAILNVWVVMRHVEVYRGTARAEAQVQQLVLREQAMQAVAQEFATRANNDPQIAAIFKRVQAMAASSVPATDLNRQPGTGR
jgi:transposase